MALPSEPSPLARELANKTCTRCARVHIEEGGSVLDEIHTITFYQTLPESQNGLHQITHTKTPHGKWGAWLGSSITKAMLLGQVVAHRQRHSCSCRSYFRDFHSLARSAVSFVTRALSF